jgi:peptidoglycan/LPS O-acetylase OafA/YrhL
LLRSIKNKNAAESQRDGAIDTLRLFGIALVIAGLHAQGYIAEVTTSSLRDIPGWSAVMSPLALGFVTIAAGWSAGHRHQRFTHASEARCYVGRRMVRLYPMYAVALSTFMLLWFTDYPLGWKALQYACAGILVTDILPPILLTLWYIQLLLVYTVLYAVIALQRTAPRRAIAAGVTLLLLLLYGTLGPGNVALAVFAPSFAFGVLLAVDHSIVHSRLTVLICTSLGIMTFVTAFVAAEYMGSEAFLPVYGCLPILLFLPTYVALRQWPALNRSRLLLLLAYSGYGAYLIHRPLLSVLERVIQPSSALTAIATYAVLGLVGSFVLGWVFQASYDWVVVSLHRKRFETNSNKEKPSSDCG